MSARRIHKLTLNLALTVFALPAAAAAGSSGPAYVPDLLPPNPETGKCYVRVEIPAQYRTETERVIVQDGYTDIDVSQTQLTARQEQVMIKEPSVRYEVRQPTYRTVTEQIMVRPSYDKLSVTPPQFRTRTQSITSSRSQLVWKKGNPAKLRAQGYKIHGTADGGVGGRGYRSTVEYGNARSSMANASGNDMIGCGSLCEIWCLVEEPSETASFTRKVLTSPAQVTRIPVPAKYEIIVKQVVADPGGVQEIPVPAEYKTMTIQEVARGARPRETQVPPVYGNVDKKVKLSSERYEWRQVVCKPGTYPRVAAPYSSQGNSQGGSQERYLGGVSSYSHSSPGTSYGYSSGSHPSTGSSYSSGTAYENNSHYGGSTYSSGSSRHSSTSSHGTSNYGTATHGNASTGYYDRDGNYHPPKREPWRTRD